MFFSDRNSANPIRHWERGETYAGLMCAVEIKEWELLISHLQHGLDLPETEEDTRLRALIMALANRLIRLVESAANSRNPMPEVFKTSVTAEARAAFDALSQTCERLELVAQQGVDPQYLQSELDGEAANLKQLLEATEEAAAEMARLTLSAGRWKVSDASNKFERLGWAARELTRFNRELDE